MRDIKQPSNVRGNIIKCINYQMCPVCYGCRAYDSRDSECRECKKEDEIRNKNYNLCNTELHESWKINKLITKTQIRFDKETVFKSKGEY